MAAFLARRGTDEAVMQEHDIPPIDMVVVNLYPFEQTVASADCDLPMAIENIDIGGPTLMRAAAKNHAAVTVLVDSDDYASVLEEMAPGEGAVSEATRFRLAVKTFEHTARYDGAIANYLGALTTVGEHAGFPANHQPAIQESAEHALWRKSPPGCGILYRARRQRSLRGHREAAAGQGAVL